MSWSVTATGKKAAVAASIDKQLAAVMCKEPEQSLKEQARALVSAAIAAQRDGLVIAVNASGSASTEPVYEEGSTSKVIDWRPYSQSIYVNVSPVSGFIE